MGRPVGGRRRADHGRSGHDRGLRSGCDGYAYLLDAPTSRDAQVPWGAYPKVAGANTFSFAPLLHFQHTTARGLRRLALHDRQAAMSAGFVELSVREMPNWFPPHVTPPKVADTPTRQPRHALPACEHHATRSAVGFFDKSFMGKVLVQGRDAESVLNRVSANSISVPVGHNVHTHGLNHQGGIISDLTIIRTGPPEYILITGDVLQSTTTAWLRRQSRADKVCAVTDVTSPTRSCRCKAPARARSCKRCRGQTCPQKRSPSDKAACRRSAPCRCVRCG